MFGKLGEAWAIMQMLLSLIPLIKEAILSLEVPGHGEEKAAAVIELVRDAWAEVPDSLKPKLGLDVIERWVNKAIAVIVRLLNAAGVFSHQVK